MADLTGNEKDFTLDIQFRVNLHFQPECLWHKRRRAILPLQENTMNSQEKRKFIAFRRRGDWLPNLDMGVSYEKELNAAELLLPTKHFYLSPSADNNHNLVPVKRSIKVQ